MSDENASVNIADQTLNNNNSDNTPQNDEETTDEKQSNPIIFVKLYKKKQ
jgi:hypothetical protein